MTDYKIELSGSYGTGRKWSTGFHMTSSSDLATVLVDMGFKVTDLWTNGTYGLETLYATTTSLTNIAVIQLDTSMRELQRIDGPATLPGTATTDEGANQLSILVSLRNVFAGERNRGRMYLPSPAEGAVAEGVLGSTEATRVSTAISAFFTGLRAGGGVIFVFNRAAHPRDLVPFTKKTVTAEKVDRVLRTQRRRIRKELAIYI